MKNWLIALGIALSIAWTCESNNPETAVVWEHFCNGNYRYDCGDLPAPQLVEDDFILWAWEQARYGDVKNRTRGMYPGGDVIYSRSLDNFKDEADQKATIYHEIVHYAQQKTAGRFAANVDEYCGREAEAFELTDRYMIAVLKTPDRVVGKQWWKAYPACMLWGIEKEDAENAAGT